VAEIPEHEREGLEFEFAAEVDDVLEAALDARRSKARRA
jgi:hypothetical protein